MIRWLLALALALAGGCGAARMSVRRADATLAIRCNIPDARLYVDEAFVGRALELAGRPLAVAGGVRRVEVRADGYFTAYRDVSVPLGGRATLDVSLRRVPDGEPGG